MEPFLRPATALGRMAKPTPDGWVAQTAGMWRGRAVEVVFDPARHDVVFLRGNQPRRVTDALVSAGWRRRGVDGRSEWWARDRVEVANRRLASRHAVGHQGGRAIA